MGKAPQEDSGQNREGDQAIDDRIIKETVLHLLDPTRCDPKRWLTNTLGWPDDQATAYVEQVSREWGEGREARMRAAGLDALPPDLVVRLDNREATREDWNFLLRRGIYLERSKAYIPWRAPVTLLVRNGGRVYHPLFGLQILEWAGELILSGYETTVRADNMLQLSGLQRLDCTPVEHLFDGDEKEVLAPEFEHLTRLFGKPNNPSIWGDSWIFGDIRVKPTVFHPNDDLYDWYKYIMITTLPIGEH